MAVLACLGIVSGSPARADDAEKVAMAHVTLSTEPGVAAGCVRLYRVSDDSVKDLRRKIVRAGGNMGILSFSSDDLSMVYAEVFRCTARAGALPPGIPPPPPGPPPSAPPPPPSR